MRAWRWVCCYGYANTSRIKMIVMDHRCKQIKLIAHSCQKYHPNFLSTLPPNKREDCTLLPQEMWQHCVRLIPIASTMLMADPPAPHHVVWLAIVGQACQCTLEMIVSLTIWNVWLHQIGCANALWILVLRPHPSPCHPQSARANLPQVIPQTPDSFCFYHDFSQTILASSQRSACVCWHSINHNHM